MIAVWAAMMLASGAAPAESIVFAATPYFDQLGIVYTNFSNHLYTMREDGSGLKQLTHGAADDFYPSPSLDGRRIWFWRSGGKQRGFRLCSVGLDGSGFRASRTVVDFWPIRGLAQALERYPRGTFRFEPDHADEPGGITVRAKSGRVIVRGGKLVFSDDGRLALSLSPTKEFQPVNQTARVIDPGTGRSIALKARFVNPRWVSGDLLEASAPDNGLSRAVLDSTGRRIVSATLPPFPAKDAPFDIEAWESPWRDDAFGLWRPGTFLLMARHDMSDGGYDVCFRVDLNPAGWKYVGNDTVEAVSPDRTRFLGTEWGWVGGYKGPGAQKLCKMYVWDAKTLTRRQVGFRLMTCEGACFVRGR